jgi:hypothetical protein
LFGMRRGAPFLTSEVGNASCKFISFFLSREIFDFPKSRFRLPNSLRAWSLYRI